MKKNRKRFAFPRLTGQLRSPSARTLVAGCGDVGLRILEQKTGGRTRIVATCRRAEQAHAIRERGACALQGDLGNPHFTRRLAALAAGGLIWLAPPPAQGSTDPWSRAMLLALGQRARRLVGRGSENPVTVVYVSTTGVYGDRQGRWTDESTPAQPANARAVRRVHAENAWRGRGPTGAPRLEGVLKAVTVLRAPGIYADDRLPLDRLRAGTPAIVAAEDSWSNHIHADDLARLAWRARWKQRGRRVINAVDNHPTRMGDYFDQVADHFGMPRPPRLPREATKERVSPMMWSFMAESRRLRNTRLAELKLRLRYPDVQSCLNTINPGGRPDAEIKPKG